VASTFDSNWAIRAAGEGDLPAILRIYNHYVETSHATFDTEPMTVGQRTGWMQQFDETGPYRLIVAHRGPSLCGFAYSAQFRSRPAYDVSVETTVYVAPKAIGRGLGRALYGSLLGEIDGAGIHRAYAGIALPNEPSVSLHEHFGFRHVGTFSEVGYKFGRYWDVAWFERRPPGRQTATRSC
jgi:phosphinothricin acetyltransferase